MTKENKNTASQQRMVLFNTSYHYVNKKVVSQELRIYTVINITENIKKTFVTKLRITTIISIYLLMDNTSHNNVWTIVKMR